MTVQTRSEEEIEAADKAATTLELFFDLVFVFAITQVVHTLSNHLDWKGVAQAGILLGVMWWGWTNWTWATNLTSLDHRPRRLVVLASMACALLMAHAVPTAFEGTGMWVAIPYVIMTQLSGLMVIDGVRKTSQDLSGIFKYSPIASLGGLLLIVGAIAEDYQEWIWFGALLLTVLASALGGREDWALLSKHFAERHALIMIIALGEAIIAVGGTLANNSETPPSWRVASYLLIGIAYVMTLYWSYFDRAQEIWEHEMGQQQGSAIARFAVEVYTWTHFPMIVGVVFSAVALEEVFANPDDHLHTFVNHIFAVAIVSFFGGIVAAAWRSTKVVLGERIVGIAAAVAIIYGLPDLNGRAVVVSVIAIFVVALIVEHARLLGFGKPGQGTRSRELNVSDIAEGLNDKTRDRVTLRRGFDHES